MAKFVALKPCNFAGQSFLIGDIVPCELVHNPNKMKSLGQIAIINDDGSNSEDEVSVVTSLTPQEGEVKFNIPIHTDEEDLLITLTNDELVQFTDVLQSPVKSNEEKKKVEDVIATVTSEDVLIAMDSLDGRKVVKEAVKVRYEELFPQNPEGAKQGSDE